MEKKRGHTKDLARLKEFFQDALSKIDVEENPVIASIFNNKDKTYQIPLEQVESFVKQGDYKKAIDNLNSLVNQGILDFDIVKLMIFCLEKRDEIDELSEFLTKILLEKERFTEKQLAYIYYKLGSTLIKLNKITQARECFWKLKKLDPNFPGIKEKLEELERKRVRTKSRYELLLDAGYLTEEQLKEAKDIAVREGTDLDEILITKFNVPKKELGKSLSSFYGVPFVEFNPKTLPPYGIFEKRKLDPNFLKQYEWVPYREEGKTIQVIMTNPFDLGRLDEIKFILGTNQIEPLVSTKKRH